MGGTLLYSELYEIINNGPDIHIYKNLKNFIETGTYKADTSIEMSKYFDNVYTIEILKNLVDESTDRAKKLHIKNITFLHGDTLNLLDEVMTYVVDEGGVFFLDAHQSGIDTSNNGKQYVPLLEELNIILSSNKKLKPSLFILDDVRFWKNNKQEAWDWSHISYEVIIEIFKKYNISIASYFEENDRFWIFTN